MTSEDHERRDVLRAVGGLAAAGTLAGCLSTGGETPAETDGSDTDTDGTATPSAAETATPGAGGFAYDEWLPTPSVFETERYSFGVLRPAALATHADVLGSNFYEDLVSGTVLTDATGVDPSAVETLAGFDSGVVLAGSFDADAVASNLEDAGFESGETYRGFDLWTGDDSSSHAGQAVGVGDGVLVAGRATTATSGGEAAKAVVDAGTDAGERYPDASEAMGALVERLQAGELRVGIPRKPPEETDAERAQFAGNTALGYRATVGGTETVVRIVFVFESESAADADAVRTWTETSSGRAMEYMQDVEVGQEGRVVSVDGTMPTGDVAASGLGGFFQAMGDDPRRSIQAGASVAVDDEANTVEVTWTSNQNADYLTAEFAPESGSATSKRIDQIGESVTYEGSDGATVTVTVRGHADDRSMVIYQRTVDL